MQLTSAQAFELSGWFTALSERLGEYRRAKSGELTDTQRDAIADAELSLLNGASKMTTVAVGLVLDESEASFQRLQTSTRRAQDAVKTLATIRKVIGVATAAVGLAGAVLSRDPGAIGKNAKSLFDAATADT